MNLIYTKRNARMTTREMINALNGYMKRAKGITNVRVSYFYDYVRIDVHAPKSSGKVYNEMINYLNGIMHDCDRSANSDYYHSHDQYLVDNNLLPEGTIIVDVCVYHW